MTPRHISKLLLSLCFAVGILGTTGCYSADEFFTYGGLWKGTKKSEDSDADKEKGTDAKPTAPAAPVKEVTPIEIRAFATGPIIQFSLRNSGSRPLPLKRDDFALVVPGGRRIIHYDPFTTNLEISPWPDTLQPGQVVVGRAIFHEVSDPVTYRFIVNPRTGKRSDAAFTVISMPGAVNLAFGGPTNDPTVTN